MRFLNSRMNSNSFRFRRLLCPLNEANLIIFCQGSAIIIAVDRSLRMEIYPSHPRIQTTTLPACDRSMPAADFSRYGSHLEASILAAGHSPSSWKTADHQFHSYIISRQSLQGKSEYSCVDDEHLISKISVNVQAALNVIHPALSKKI